MQQAGPITSSITFNTIYFSFYYQVSFCYYQETCAVRAFRETFEKFKVTGVNAGMQFEVVLRLEELLADLAFELSAHPVRREMAAKVPFTREHLDSRRQEQHNHSHILYSMNRPEAC